MAPSKINHLCHFCFGDVVGKDAANTNTTLMDVKHDARRVFLALVEDTFEHQYDELHRRVVVVEKKHHGKGLGAAGPLNPFPWCTVEDVDGAEQNQPPVSLLFRRRRGKRRRKHQHHADGREA